MQVVFLTAGTVRIRPSMRSQPTSNFALLRRLRSVYISREHWKAFGEHPLFASFEGATPNRWPKGFAPRVIDLQERKIWPWKQSYPLTVDGNLVVVDTSGHVPGHIGLVIFSKERDGEEKRIICFLPGGATYGIDILEKEEPDGINDDPMRPLQTLKTIKQFARECEVVVLPSHDIDTHRLLAKRVLLIYRPAS